MMELYRPLYNSSSEYKLSPIIHPQTYVMNYVYKSLSIAAIVTLTIAFALGPHEIKLKVDPNTGNIADPETPCVGWFGGVKWIIDDTQIESFQIVEKEGNSHYIFKHSLPTVLGKELHMKLKNRKPPKGEWYYKIIWIDKKKQTQILDPKIAVKPVIGFAELILLLGFITTYITSVVFYPEWRKARGRSNHPPRDR
jgi:hypothetical protein